MAAGSGNWTLENATNASSGECNSSAMNTTWLETQMYPGQMVDRVITPVWYLVGVTGTRHSINQLIKTCFRWPK